jgi:hypothetical protein
MHQNTWSDSENSPGGTSSNCTRSGTSVLQSTDQEVIAATKATEASAQNLLASDGLLLPTLKAFARTTRWIHATRNAWCFQYTCSSKTVFRSRQKQPPVPRPPPPHSSIILRTAPDTSTRNHGGDHILGYDLCLL